MALLAYTIKQYPAKEQAELRVVVKMPGSWFGGQLTEAERAELYECQAYESFEAHEFPKKGARARQVCPAIKFMCESDVFDDPKAPGFIMPLAD